jgi:hypothetical protein
MPEWGAILAEGFRLLRWRPFVVFPPAVAFFVAVLGLNALGEGLRRLIDQAGLSTGFLLRKRMVLVLVGVTLATLFIVNNTGPAPWFSKVAEAYNGRLAYEHVKALAAMDGRGAGQAGGHKAAEYIAEKFEAYGLEPGWKGDSFVYPLETRLVEPSAQPYLALLDADGQPKQEYRHQLEFGYMIDGHGGSGDLKAPVTFVGFEFEPNSYDWESFKGLDLRDRIVLLLEGNAPSEFPTEALIRGARGVLWVIADDVERNQPTGVRSQRQLATPGRDYLARPNIPIFRIRSSILSDILKQDGILQSDLLLRENDPLSGLSEQGAAVAQSGPGWFTKDLSAAVHMSLTLGEVETVKIPCVLGYKMGSDFDLSGQLVVLFTAYDGLGSEPDGTVFQAANHNASGVGMILEIARVWHEQNLNARRSVLFVAWGAGELGDPGAVEFFRDSRNFPRLSTRSLYGGFAPGIIFEPDNVGAGDDTLFIHPDSGDRLARVLTEALSEVEIPVTSEQEGESRQAGAGVRGSSRRTQWLHFAWSNSWSSPDQDGFERIDADKLQRVGEAFSLALTRIVRQSSY